MQFICRVCKKEFSDLNKFHLRKFCSLKCFGISVTKEKITFKCNYCNKLGSEYPSTYKQSKRHFCDKKCEINFIKYNYKKEEQHAWKGGITPLNRIEREKFKQNIQKQVFERDDYKCQVCQKGGSLQVDHIFSWSKYPNMRFNIDNCRTLCMKCHYKVTYHRDMPKNIKSWGINKKFIKNEL